MIEWRTELKNKAVWLAFLLGLVVGIALGSSTAVAAHMEPVQPCGLVAADVLTSPGPILSRCREFGSGKTG